MNGLALRKDDIPLHSARGLVEGEMHIHRMTQIVPLTVRPAYRSDNQVSESFFSKYKRLIKEDQELYVSLLCQHTNLEGKSGSRLFIKMNGSGWSVADMRRIGTPGVR